MEEESTPYVISDTPRQKWYQVECNNCHSTIMYAEDNPPPNHFVNKDRRCQGTWMFGCKLEIQTRSGNIGSPNVLSLEKSVAVGVKKDSGKLRWNLLFNPFMEECVRVLMHGAIKRGDWNWMGIKNARERCYNSAQRHLKAWFDGEEYDVHGEDASGFNHLAHAFCNLMFLYYHTTLHKNEIYKPSTYNIK